MLLLAKVGSKLIVNQEHIDGSSELKKIFFIENKPINNFDILIWVAELGIKNFDGVFSKNNVKSKNCGIINLDDHGPGTHWVCYINNIYFDPFCLPPPQSLKFIDKFNNLQYQERNSVLCGYFCLFFIKKFQDGYSLYDILYKLLDPLNQKANEKNNKLYFIDGYV